MIETPAILAVGASEIVGTVLICLALAPSKRSTDIPHRMFDAVASETAAPHSVHATLPLHDGGYRSRVIMAKALMRAPARPDRCPASPTGRQAMERRSTEETATAPFRS